MQFFRSFRLTPNWKILILTALFFPLLLSLGFWQLQRADEKQQIKIEQQRQQLMPPVSLQQLLKAERTQYRQVAFQGHYLNNKNYLLDNQVRLGRVGYEVITPFQLITGEVVLVNRGWLKGGRYRSDFPVIPVVEGVVGISGTAYQPIQNKLVASPKLLGDDWPKIIQSVDVNELAVDLDTVLPSFTVRLQEGVSGSLLTGWPVVNLQPEKHVGYAVQWFLMALVLVVLSVFANTNLRSLFRKTDK